VADALGGTLVVWRHRLSQDRSVILAQRIDAQGNPLWGAGGLRVSLRASNQTNPRVARDNMSGMAVAWRDEANNASELRVQRIDFQGNRLWSLEGLKVAAPMGAADFPSIAAVGTGSVAIAWNTSERQTSQILLQRVGPEPVLKWGPALYASQRPPTYNRWNPALWGNEGGGVWVGWEDFGNLANYQIQVNHLNEGGSSVWPSGELTAAPALGDQGKMTLTGNGNGGVWMAWIDNRLSDIALYVQEIDGAGARLQGPGGRRVADHLTKSSKPQLVSLGGGQAAVVWTERPKKDQWTLSWAIVGTP
jgi:hypothetical protein